MENFKKIYHRLPESGKKIVRAVHRAVNKVPFTAGSRRDRWILKNYTGFERSQRQFIFYSAARFCVINRPINGYYFEFGCHEANTMRMAWKTFRWLFDWKYVAFDSFEGLPEIAEIDRQEIWRQGKLKTTEEEFVRKVCRAGLPREKLILVKGYYDQALTEDLQRRLLPEKAAMIYIDCDLYMSTVPVLKFIRPFLQKGTILVFDDWYCFHGDPSRGEQKAFSEFLADNPDLHFQEFVQTNEAKSFIYLGEQILGSPRV